MISDVRHAVALERSGVGGLQPVDDLGLALGPEHRRALDALDLAHLVGQRGAAVQQLQQLAVHRVDLDAQFRKGLGHVGSVRFSCCRRREDFNFRMQAQRRD